MTAQPQPLTPAAQAVLETGLAWQAQVDRPDEPGWLDAKTAAKITIAHLDAIRRYREELG